MQALGFLPKAKTTHLEPAARPSGGAPWSQIAAQLQIEAAPAAIAPAQTGAAPWADIATALAAEMGVFLTSTGAIR